jgi:hypothetical protein
LLKYRLESKIKLANLILEINQLMYNLLREKTRKNNLNVKYLESILTDKLVSFYFYLKGIPLIHDKERLKLIDSKHILYKFIKSILNNKYNLIKNKLNDYLINSSYSLNLISKKYSKFIEDYRDEIIYNRNDYQNKIKISFEITDIEFEMHKALNAYGGVQECQLNKNYYFIMRLSQHLNMSLEFLIGRYIPYENFLKRLIDDPFVESEDKLFISYLYNSTINQNSNSSKRFNF